jgi:hypothetical protein
LAKLAVSILVWAAKDASTLMSSFFSFFILSNLFWGGAQAKEIVQYFKLWKLLGLCKIYFWSHDWIINDSNKMTMSSTECQDFCISKFVTKTSQKSEVHKTN